MGTRIALLRVGDGPRGAVRVWRRTRHAAPLTSQVLSEPLERRRMLDAQPIGPEFRANTFTDLNQLAPSLAMDANGNFVIAWQSFAQDGSGYGIYAQRYNSAGVAQGAEFRANSTTANDQSAPSVAMDADGDFVIVWESSQQTNDAMFGIYAQRYNAAGQPQGSEIHVNTFTTGDQRFPSVAMNADGDFVVAWHGTLQEGSSYGVFAQRFSAAGVPQGAEFRANTFTTLAQAFPAVEMDAGGNFVIAWQSLNQDLAGYGVYAQRYDAAGTPQGSEFRVNSTTSNDQRFPAVAMDDAGDFVVTWESFGQDGAGLGVFAQRYNAAGAPQGGELQVNSTTAGAQRAASIAMDADGDFVIGWQSAGQDSSGYGVYAQCFNALGQPQGTEFRANSFTADAQAQPSVAVDADGDFAIAWHSANQDGSGYGIYTQRFGAAPPPGIDASAFLFETAPHRLAFTFNQNVSASLGTDDIVLENLTTSQTIPSTDLSLAYDLGTNIATFSYIGPGGALIPTVLPDGNYRATLIAAGITNPAGTPLPADHVFNFFFLNADATRDARVNLDDFNVLAANFGTTGGAVFSQADFDYDGNVNLNDFNILAGRFGTVLPSQPAGAGFTSGPFERRRSHFADRQLTPDNQLDELS